MIEYKGYAGLMHVDPEAGMIEGRTVGMRDIVTFQGRTVEEAVQSFRDSVDSYLAFCQEIGKEPDLPFSGKFLVRISPGLHRALAIAAEIHQVSLDSLVENALKMSLREIDAPAGGEATEKTSKTPSKRPAPGSRKPGRVASKGR